MSMATTSYTEEVETNITLVMTRGLYRTWTGLRMWNTEHL